MSLRGFEDGSAEAAADSRADRDTRLSDSGAGGDLDAAKGGDGGLPLVRVARDREYLDVRIEFHDANAAFQNIHMYARESGSSAMDAQAGLFHLDDGWHLYTPLCLHPALYGCSVAYDACHYVETYGTAIRIRIPLAYAHRVIQSELIVQIYATAGASPLEVTVPVEAGPLPDFLGQPLCPAQSRIVGSRSDFLAIAVPSYTYALPDVVDGGCALASDGSVHCWGDHPTPPAGPFTKLGAARGPQLCAVTDKGQMQCWVLGTSFSPTPVPPPVDLPPGQVVKELSSVGLCAILDSGAVRCWDESSHRDVDGQFTSVSGDLENGCAVTQDGSITCWGFDASYEDWSRAKPQSRLVANDYLQVAVAEDVVCARRGNGEVECVSPWESVRFEGNSFVRLSETRACICALASDGTPTCMGNCLVPHGLRAAQILSNSNGLSSSPDSCALLLDGRITCWGSGLQLP